jgi:hypothetical protein
VTHNPSINRTPNSRLRLQSVAGYIERCAASKGGLMSELPALYKNILLLASGIEACIEKKVNNSALILIYSGIDTVGWLDSTEEFTSKPGFITWVDTYLLKAKPLACTSLDLYAARCGLLHTFTPDSKLRSEGKARYINYAWGTASVEKLQRTIDLTKKSDNHVALHVNDLYEAWRLGVLRFCEEVEKDPDRKARVYEKADQFFAELGLGTISDVLTVIDQDKGV